MNRTRTVLHDSLLSLSHFSIKTQYSAQQNAKWQAVIKADVLRKRQEDIIGNTLFNSDVSQSSILNITTDSMSERFELSFWQFVLINENIFVKI